MPVIVASSSILGPGELLWRPSSGSGGPLRPCVTAYSASIVSGARGGMLRRETRHTGWRKIIWVAGKHPKHPKRLPQTRNTSRQKGLRHQVFWRWTHPKHRKHPLARQKHPPLPGVLRTKHLTGAKPKARTAQGLPAPAGVFPAFQVFLADLQLCSPRRYYQSPVNAPSAAAERRSLSSQSTGGGNAAFAIPPPLRRWWFWPKLRRSNS